MKIMFFAACSALLLGGCSMTLPVRGQVTDGSETFTGTATGEIDGGGVLKIVSSKGRVCEGNFVYVSRRDGEGIINCNDGSSGSFKFVSTGTRGTGNGEISGRRFTFTFG